MNIYAIRPAEPMYFAVRVHMRRGLTHAQELAFLRRLELWIAERDLVMEGAQTAFTIVAQRDLTPTDQADLLIALLDDPTVREGRVGPLVGSANDLSQEVTGLLWVEACAHDHLVDAARALYESGRLNGAGFLEALGSFVYRPSENLEAEE